jgi:hypothetical protein
VAFSADGTLLASAGSASSDNTLRIWDPATGQELRRLKGHMNGVWSVAFSADGRLASAGGDNTVKLWDPTTGQELRTLKGHTEMVHSVAFSGDGTRLASAGHDQTVNVWDGRPLTPKVAAEVEAVDLLDSLVAKPLPTAVVRAALQKHVIVSDAARARALELVARFHEETDPSKYYAAAWPVLRHPYANVFIAEAALAQMKAAHDRAPNEDKYRMALGAAHYRLGKFQKEHYQHASALLAKCDHDRPATLAFLAMTQQRLGQKTEAAATLDRLRKLLQTGAWAKDADSQAFLAEAATLVQP